MYERYISVRIRWRSFLPDLEQASSSRSLIKVDVLDVDRGSDGRFIRGFVIVMQGRFFYVTQFEYDNTHLNGKSCFLSSFEPASKSPLIGIASISSLLTMSSCL